MARNVVTFGAMVTESHWDNIETELKAMGKITPKKLLKAGTGKDHGNSVVHQAAAHGLLGRLAEWLPEGKKFTPEQLLSARNVLERTPFHEALRHGETEPLKNMLSGPVPLEDLESARDDTGNSPVDMAVMTHHIGGLANIVKGGTVPWKTLKTAAESKNVTETLRSEARYSLNYGGKAFTVAQVDEETRKRQSRLLYGEKGENLKALIKLHAFSRPEDLKDQWLGHMPADIRKKFNADPVLTQLCSRESARLGRQRCKSRSMESYRQR